MTLIGRQGDVKAVNSQGPQASYRTLPAKFWTNRRPSSPMHIPPGGIGEYFSEHHTVDLNKTFVRGVIMQTSFAESNHSLKRGIIAAFHHIGDKHFSRYLGGSNRRWNTRNDSDGEPTVNVIAQASASD